MEPVRINGGRGMQRLLGIREVCTAIGRSRSTVNRYLTMPELHFPRPVRLGPNARAWYADEIERWTDGLPSIDPDQLAEHELRG